ncbi:MAG: hypothetical protein Q4D29_12800, partial [Lachnospiraceae bacterium]|nr:hypothetical protein [Lachnospiraceae bacterium]
MKNIIKHNLKQKIWLTGCVTLLFVLCRPMMQLMTYENEKRYAITKEALISVMERFFLPNVFTDYVPTAIACVVIGIVFFSYLFSKKRVDLYHSIPVDRRHLFVANYISGVVVYLIALFAEFIICTFVAIPNHYMTLVSVENMIAALFINFVHFMFGYGVVITAIMLSGNAVVALALSAVIALIYPVVVSLIRYFEGYFYVTYNNCDIVKQNLLTKYYWLSPITSYATIIQRVNYEWELFYYEKVSMAYAALILPLIMTIVFTAIAYLLYMKRPSEAAGRAIAFKNTRAYIEIPFVITCGLTGGWFMSTSMNTYKPSWIWIGVLLGAILSHCVLEAILNESFKSILSHKIQFVVSIAVVVIIMGIFYTDATKYDYYVPNKDSVASANVYFCDIDSNLSSIEFIEDEKNPGYYVPEYKDRQDTLFTQRFTDGVMIEKIIGISNIGVSCVPEMIDRKQSNEDEAYYGKYDYAT